MASDETSGQWPGTPPEMICMGVRVCLRAGPAGYPLGTPGGGPRGAGALHFGPSFDGFVEVLLSRPGVLNPVWYQSRLRFTLLPTRRIVRNYFDGAEQGSGTPNRAAWFIQYNLPTHNNFFIVAYFRMHFRGLELIR